MFFDHATEGPVLQEQVQYLLISSIHGYRYGSVGAD